ncbi:uncharacterized protein UBRO2_00475 [Ustilago bromivora]|uniref:tRNA-splicing endonuclease subunit Sen15 domain-containing protein n=1 Tax=Ustilago bromivora TaxID=307758 RepID=A0A8H8QI55_9BASI|nr:uncharacterized protein UBRO2_00475 [Ustilago bromivora]
MASTSIHSVGGSSRSDSSPLPAATSHQLSKSQQSPLCKQYPIQASAIFQTYLDLKNGAAAWDFVEPLALSSQEASTSGNGGAEVVVKQDLVGLSDAEAEALVQEKLAEVQGGVSKLGLISGKGEEEEENLLRTGLAAMKGRRKDANNLQKAYEVVIPLTITQHLRADQLKAIFTLLDKHAEAVAPTGQEIDTSHVLLAIIAPDSTLVYYLVSKGFVKPIN